MAHTIARSGAGMSGASSVHLNLFGPNPVVVFGTDEQKARMLPPLIQGLDRACFGVTEPDAGLNTTRLATRAARDGDHYRVSGRKLWTTTAQTQQNSVNCPHNSPRGLRQANRRADSLLHRPGSRPNRSQVDRQNGSQRGGQQCALYRRLISAHRRSNRRRRGRVEVPASRLESRAYFDRR